MVDRMPIKGGLEKYTTDKSANYRPHIGRGYYKDQLMTGKVNIGNSTYAVLFVAYNNQSIGLENFEVLVYDVYNE